MGLQEITSQGQIKKLQVGGVGTELSYNQIVSDSAGVTATTEGTSVAVVTGSSFAADGTKVKVEFWCHSTTGGSTAVNTLVLYRDSTVIGQSDITLSSSAAEGPIKLEFYDTPSAGSHSYTIKLFVNSGTGVIKAGAGSGTGTKLPAFLRVTKA